jgi:hypothetical protein
MATLAATNSMAAALSLQSRPTGSLLYQFCRFTYIKNSSTKAYNLTNRLYSVLCSKSVPLKAQIWTADGFQASMQAWRTLPWELHQKALIHSALTKVKPEGRNTTRFTISQKRTSGK